MLCWYQGGCADEWNLGCHVAAYGLIAPFTHREAGYRVALAFLSMNPSSRQIQG